MRSRMPPSRSRRRTPESGPTGWPHRECGSPVGLFEVRCEFVGGVIMGMVGADSWQEPHHMSIRPCAHWSAARTASGRILPRMSIIRTTRRDVYRLSNCGPTRTAQA